MLINCLTEGRAHELRAAHLPIALVATDNNALHLTVCFRSGGERTVSVADRVPVQAVHAAVNTSHGQGALDRMEAS